ncbi:UNVERIFIED_CONTAM: hypothetical protein Slati_2233500 [Sesamum latifolium]|uniref:Uncharacterized protein n=1 Tax=Sesamum latifolium TaxID=2727402 RepID=A0AAW2WU81_9LAMI
MACVNIICFVDQLSNLSILLLDLLHKSFNSPSQTCKLFLYSGSICHITGATFVVKGWLDTERGEDGGDLFPSSSLAWLGEPKSFWTYSVRGVIWEESLIFFDMLLVVTPTLLVLELEDFDVVSLEFTNFTAFP